MAKEHFYQKFIAWLRIPMSLSLSLPLPLSLPCSLSALQACEPTWQKKHWMKKKNCKWKSLTQLSIAYPLPSAISSLILHWNSKRANIHAQARAPFNIGHFMCINPDIDTTNIVRFVSHSISLEKKRYLFVNDLITIIQYSLHYFRSC